MHVSTYNFTPNKKVVFTKSNVALTFIRMSSGLHNVHVVNCEKLMMNEVYIPPPPPHTHTHVLLLHQLKHDLSHSTHRNDGRPHLCL